MKYTEYENKTIAEVMTRINVDLFIPAIQRPYVWDVSQIERLFDSIMKEYLLLTTDEREELKLLGYEEWLSTRDSAQRTWHSLPHAETVQFDLFCRERAREIRKGVGKLIAPVTDFAEIPA